VKTADIVVGQEYASWRGTVPLAGSEYGTLRVRVEAVRQERRTYGTWGYHGSTKDGVKCRVLDKETGEPRMVGSLVAGTEMLSPAQIKMLWSEYLVLQDKATAAKNVILDRYGRQLGEYRKAVAQANERVGFTLFRAVWDGSTSRPPKIEYEVTAASAVETLGVTLRTTKEGE
jgi:hypothetical protein